MQYDKEFNGRLLNCPMKSESKQLQNNSVSNITR